MENMKKKRKQKWIKPRHTLVRNLLFPFIKLLCKMKYHIKVNKFKDKRQFLIVSNHQTPFDQFFVSLSFKKHIYYVTNDDLFSNGFVSWLIDFLVKPIPIKKGTSDVKAVLDCKRVVKEGGSIAIFPEGNRTYSGKTEYIKETIAPFARSLKLPIAIYHIHGGYGVHPRWSDKTRKGKMSSGVSEIIEYESYKDLSDKELYDLICNKLYVNESRIDNKYYSKNSAEYLERAMYFCPKCSFGKWESHGDKITCLGCGTTVKYLPTKELVGVNCDFPYSFISEWYDAQCSFIRSLDLTPYYDTPLFEDNVNLSEVIPCKKKIPLGENVTLRAYADRYELALKDMCEVVPFSSVTAAVVLGRNKLNYYSNKRIFQVKGNVRFNAVKYLNIYYHSVNVAKGDTENGTLGL
ncbi:MAG: 1-acyl-sn-glycerol-3-phosphate acyltransferase [Clostridia bacterium]|nr:1-acyl-sn-glycerol-3-phosphate acyltransferase [Clostridia bacterium]